MNAAMPADFERFLAPVGRALGQHAEVARSLLEVRADAPTQLRYEDLATRNCEGSLSPSEHSELESLVLAANVVAYLQAAARAALASA